MLSIEKDPASRGGYVLRAETLIERPLDEVFPFFADAMNLEKLTPDFMNFHVLTPPPIEMRDGQIIDYRLKVRGIPLRWRSEITNWDPPHRFSDIQLKGPYRYWRHQHLFEATDEGTLCKDIVHYAVPGGALIHWLMVRRDVTTIFEYREQTLRQVFAKESAPQAV